jgi:hypothetical protein
MTNDPELKAMSEVFDALQKLDVSTQKRVVDWVMTKLQSSSATVTSEAKRGPKPGLKRGTKRGRKVESTSPESTTGAKRGPKLKSKRGPKPGSGGRPKGSGKKSTGVRRGRPRKNP